MQVDLKALLILQEKDSAVRAIEEQLGALQPQLERLDRTLNEIESQLETARGHEQEAEKRRGELEERIESYRVMQERRRQKLEWVRGAKEASTIMAELDLARSVLAKEEAEWIRSADRVQEAAKIVSEAEAALNAAREEQAPTRADIAVKSEELEGELRAARAQRHDASKTVEPRLLELYERILRGRAPQALYPLRGGACGHCFTSVPLHRRQQIENDRAVEPCEACGVLVYKELDG